jgi:hypothetical protein
VGLVARLLLDQLDLYCMYGVRTAFSLLMTAVWVRELVTSAGVWRMGFVWCACR